VAAVPHLRGERGEEWEEGVRGSRGWLRTRRSFDCALRAPLRMTILVGGDNSRSFGCASG